MQKLDCSIEQWKIKRIIKELDNVKGNGTSMITLIIPHKKNVVDVSKMLIEEQGSAANIKSNTNKKSVLVAIASAREKLKLYSKIPNNGLVIFTGLALQEDGKTEKKINFGFEPFKPLHNFGYHCDKIFRTESLKELLENDETYGFIIIDGSGALYGTVQGKNKTTILKFSVSLPKKHNKGGQSSLRFARLREEMRHNYVRKICENATQIFISNDKPNVKGIILAGFADFKTEVFQSDMFDTRLKNRVLKILDISYGGDNGFNQAINLSQECFKNEQFIEEKNVLSQFFQNISTDTNLVSLGFEQTINALQDGAVDKILLYENLDIIRGECVNLKTNESCIKYYQKDSKVDFDNFETHNQILLSEWIVENYANYGASLHLISDKSEEGFQFVKGFGGLGALLRYKIDTDTDVEINNSKDDNDDYFI